MCRRSTSSRVGAVEREKRDATGIRRRENLIAVRERICRTGQIVGERKILGRAAHGHAERAVDAALIEVETRRDAVLVTGRGHANDLHAGWNSERNRARND